MTACIFTGCSYTAGSGWPDLDNDHRLWAKSLHQTHPALAQTRYLNFGIGGASNARIFYESVRAMLAHPGSIVFVAWTSTARFELDLGFETYDCRQVFIPNSPMRDHKLNTHVFSAKYLRKIRDQFVSLVHDHREICGILGYTTQLIKLAQLQQSRIFFVNALCPWDAGFFHKIDYVLPNTLTPYTQQLLQVSTRDDNEVQQLYNNMHHDYDTQGGIHNNKWLNLYQSIRSLQTDVNYDGIHPGEKTNQIITNLFLTTLDQLM